ncbi:MAG: hypothetical protein M3R38_09580 [Actinomycetota bacterium]|nr:hypothetical protein [Actinomycetota bacterium]
MAEETFGSGKVPEYPWQLEASSGVPAAKMTEGERRADFARFQFDYWKALLDEGLGRHPLLFYDERRGFFRFSDGTFALPRERADWPALKEKGFFSEWSM